MAEREGFEPSRAINSGSFQDCCLQPLGHLSLGKTSRITPSACASVERRLTVGFTYRSTTFSLQHSASGAILNVLRSVPSRITPSACASGRNSFNVGFTHVSRTFLPAERRIWRNPERFTFDLYSLCGSYFHWTWGRIL